MKNSYKWAITLKLNRGKHVPRKGPFSHVNYGMPRVLSALQWSVGAYFPLSNPSLESFWWIKKIPRTPSSRSYDYPKLLLKLKDSVTSQGRVKKISSEARLKHIWNFFSSEWLFHFLNAGGAFSNRNSTIVKTR